MTPPAFSKRHERERLIALREAQTPDRRLKWDAALLRHLLKLLEEEYTAISAVLTLGLYLPMRGEPDLTVLIDLWPGVVALPEVVDAHAPLRYLRYDREIPLEAGRLGTRVPSVKEDAVPDVIIAPCVGFFVSPEPACYRLGFGGGFFDRTLEQQAITTIGVSYALGRLDAFDIEAHDQPLAAIVTEDGPVVAPSA